MASSVRFVRRCSFPETTFRPISVILPGAAAGRKFVNASRVSLLKDLRGRNSYPQNVNDHTGKSRRRFPSLQNTTFVLSGCRVRPTPANRRPTASRTSSACLSVTQWITASSANRSKGQPGYSRAIHEVGWPGASQPPAPTDPYVSLSAHTALLIQLSEVVRPPPVREQPRFTSGDPVPPRLGSLERPQPLVLLARPPQDAGVDPVQKRHQRGPVKPAVVAEPPGHDLVDPC